MSKETLVIRNIIEGYVQLDISRYIMSFVNDKNIFHSIIYCSCDECPDPWEITEGYRCKDTITKDLIYCTDCFEFGNFNIHDFNYFKTNYTNVIIDSKDIHFDVDLFGIGSRVGMHFCKISIWNYIEDKTETHKCIMKGPVIYRINKILGKDNGPFEKWASDDEYMDSIKLLRNVTLTF